jgi:hypothetical protein
MCSLIRAAILMTALFCTSCSNGESDQWKEGRKSTTPVSGTVTLDGKTIDGAIVLFRSESAGLTANGRTDAQGRFTLSTYENGDGAVPGTYTVSVSKIEHKVTPDPKGEPFPPTTEEIWHIPAVYTEFDTSNLTATVTEATENTANLELVSQPSRSSD